jgi:hypothetical protein
MARFAIEEGASSPGIVHSVFFFSIVILINPFK